MDITARNENIKNFFDNKAYGYDDVHAKFAKTKSLLTKALPEACKKVLDLGAGTGMELVSFFERFPNARVVATDISEQMLEGLMKRDFADKVDVICGDFFKISFDKDFDAVISTSALHHFDEENKLILYQKIFECLCDGGIFVNADKVAESQAIQDEWLDYWLNNPDGESHIDTPLTVENELKILKRAGFSSISVSDTDISNYRLIKAIK